MRLLFAGDVMLGRLVNRVLERKPPEFPWGDTLGLIKSADVSICNLECVVSDRGRPWSTTPKAFHFRTDSKNVECLKAAGFDAVSLANNHSLDYEYDAAYDTLDILDSVGIAHAGFGRNFDEASRIAYFERGGFRLALVAFTDNEPGWEARDGVPGVFYSPIDLEDPRALRLFEKIGEAKREADIVIASAHWGPNWGYRPVASHRPFGEAMVEAGADFVFGHSCHVFQGIEVYKGSPIMFGAGDFVDDYAVDEVERNDESFIFAFDWEGYVKGIRLYPTIITDFHAELAPYPRAELIAGKMKTLAGEFGLESEWIEDEGCLSIRP
ncbi:MAG: CapA family protein [Deltaproteobacteria bacterium]|nr:CapA family protein [Deltaproteobacteria bacterium]